MKPFIPALLLLIALACTSCKKNDSLADLIIGKWQLVSSTVATTTQVATSNLYVKFNDDGSLSGTAFPGFNTYKVNQPSSLITLTGPGVTNIYTYTFINNMLVMSASTVSIANDQRFQKVP